MLFEREVLRIIPRGVEEITNQSIYQFTTTYKSIKHDLNLNIYLVSFQFHISKISNSMIT